MRLPDYLLTHTIGVRPYLGTTGNGPAHGRRVELPAFVDENRRTVSDGDGRAITSGSTVYVQLDAPVAITPEARIDVRGQPAEVLRVRRRDGGGLPTPDHIEIALR